MCAIFGLIDYNHTLNAKQREKVLRVLSHIIIILLADDMFSQDSTSCVSCCMEQQRLCQLSR